MEKSEEERRIWMEIRFDKKRSERLMVEIGQMMVQYRRAMAGRQLRLRSSVLDQRIVALLHDTERTSAIIYPWVDPRLWGERFMAIDKEYNRPLQQRDYAGRLETWFWLVLIAPAYRAWKRLPWRWRRWQPNGDLEVLRRGRRAIQQLLLEQVQLREFLMLALLPENQHALSPEETVEQMRKLAARASVETAVEEAKTEAVEQTALQQVEAMEIGLPPEQIVPVGYVRIGPLGTMVREDLAEAWTKGDGWKKPGEAAADGDAGKA